MFDFAWSEIALIAAVALIAIGPKDLPVAIKAVTGMIKKARRMASEFQTHVDEMIREADLGDVQKSFNEIRNFDIKGAIEKAVDPDGGLRSTFASNPLEPDSATPVTSMEEIAVAETPAAEALAAPDLGEPAIEVVPPPESVSLAPAFIPPGFASLPEPLPIVRDDTEIEEPPAFVPPEVVRQRQARG